MTDEKDKKLEEKNQAPTRDDKVIRGDSLVQWEELLEDIADTIETTMGNDHVLQDYVSSIILEISDDGGIDIMIDIEGDGNWKYRELIDKRVSIALKEARSKVEKHFGSKRKIEK